MENLGEVNEAKREQINKTLILALIWILKAKGENIRQGNDVCQEKDVSMF